MGFEKGFGKRNERSNSPKFSITSTLSLRPYRTKIKSPFKVSRQVWLASSKKLTFRDLGKGWNGITKISPQKSLAHRLVILRVHAILLIREINQALHQLRPAIIGFPRSAFDPVIRARLCQYTCNFTILLHVCQTRQDFLFPAAINFEQLSVRAPYNAHPRSPAGFYPRHTIFKNEALFGLDFFSPALGADLGIDGFKGY